MIPILRKTIFISIISIFIIGSLFLFSQNSQSYDDKTTHPGLTDEIVDFYNLSFDDKLTAQEKEWIVQGAIDEDTPPRWINHFYDPTNGDGWKSENLGGVSSSTLKIFTRIFLNSNTEIVSSKNWVHNESLQLKYAGYGGNRTWENAIRRYANGDKEYAYKTLGHILHLLEDKTVPDHTRNDTHAHEGSVLTKDGGSPYEDYGKDWNRFNLTTAKDLKNENKSPVILNSIDGYLDYLANYSNKYFFSEHTINSEKYDSPNINTLDRQKFNNTLIGYGQDSSNNKLPLVKIKKTIVGSGDVLEEYSIDEKYILENYFSRLSREAVMSGAGAIKLFEEEVAKAEKDKSLISKEPKISWWQQMRSPLYGAIIPAYNSATSVFNSVQNIFSQSQFVNPMAYTANIGQIANQESRITNQESPEENLADDASNNESALTEEDADIEISPEIEIQPEFANNAPEYQEPAIEIIHAPWRGDDNASDEILDNSNNQQKENGKNNLSDQAGVSYGQDNISFGGENNKNLENDGQENSGAEDDELNQENNEDIEGVVDEQEGDDQNQEDENLNEPNVQEGEDDNQGDENNDEGDEDGDEENQEPENQQDEPEEPALPVTPDSNFYLTDYNVRNKKFALNWEDKNRVIQNWELQYKLGPNFDWQSITEYEEEGCENDEENNEEIFCYDFTANYNDLTYYFRLRGQDAGGEFTDWQTLQADISEKPVVINEIAWAGTKSSANDEWIELANKTDQEIDMSGWTLKTTDGNINAVLSGKIAPNGFYLLERTNDDPIADIVADQFYTGALTNKQNNGQLGQDLILSDDQGAQIDSAYTLLAGDNSGNKKTSERISVWVDGKFQSNWQNYKGMGAGEKDSAGNNIFGTPKAKNSVSDYNPLSRDRLDNCVEFAVDTILLKDRGPYYLSGGCVNVALGVILIIEPGSELKYGSFHIRGKLTARGAQDNRIKFLGGPGGIYVHFYSGSFGELDNIYIGEHILDPSSVPIYSNAGNIKITNSVFENISRSSIAVNSSDYEISGNEFGYNRNGFAIEIDGGTGTITGNNFIANAWGNIFIRNSDGEDSIQIYDNQFSSVGAAVVSDDFKEFVFRDNEVSKYFDKNISIHGLKISDGETAVFNDDASYSLLDYVRQNSWMKFGNPKVEFGGTLKIDPGKIIVLQDGNKLEVSGRLEVMGTPENPVIFTTNKDIKCCDGVSLESVVGSVFDIDDLFIFNDGSEVVMENVIIRYPLPNDQWSFRSYLFEQEIDLP